MHRERDEEFTDQSRRGLAGDPAERFARDCLLLEVMPPTWTWAYRKLLNAGETGSRFTDRLA
jgi:hypothetical protein